MTMKHHIPEFSEPVYISIGRATPSKQLMSSGVFFKKIRKYCELSTTIRGLILCGDMVLKKMPVSLFQLCRGRGISLSVDPEFSDYSGIKTLQKRLQFMNQIRFRVYSLLEDKHDRLFGRRGNYQLMMEAMNQSVQFNGSRVALFVISKHNYKELTSAADFFASRNMYISPLLSQEFFLANDAEKKLHWRIAKLVARIKNKYPTKVFSDFPLGGARYPGISGWCPAGRLSMHFSQNGEAFLCAHSKEVIALLYERSVIQCWSVCKSRVRAMSVFCQRKKCFAICGGGCFARYKPNSKRDPFCSYTL